VGKSPNGYKGKMRADFAAITVALATRRRVSVAEVMRSRGISRATAYRRLQELGETIPISFCEGTAVVDESFDFSIL
jgi:DeoR/GlpR family transcriptional regulator of sugar metabolism